MPTRSTTRPTMIKLLLATVLLAGACRTIPGPPSPTPDSSSEATPFTPPDFPPLPTATLFTPPESARDVFSAPEQGVTLRYPPGWSAAADDTDPSILTWLYSRGGTLGILFVTPVISNETLQETAAGIHQANLEFLDEPEVTRDEAIRLDDGREAWQTFADGTWPDSTERVALSLTTAIRGGRAVTLLFFNSPAQLAEELDEINAVIASLRLEAPLLYGIPRDQALVLLGGESTNPRDYDPATTYSGSDKKVFGGLVSFDPQLNLVPDLAESWSISPDGTTYTFTLRANARFHNGRPVTADDIIYSWERAADPETESNTVLTYLGDIVGVREMRDGQADHIAGLRVIDERTIQVTLDAPKPYFLFKLTYPTAFVVDRANVESAPDWYRTPNGTGPYRLVRWDSFELMLYERNEIYHLDPPSIPYVIVQLYTGVGLRLYEVGDIDVTGIGYYDVPRMLDPQEPLHTDLLTGVSLCTSYVVFDVEQPPFDDPLVRQAFTMAFDREQYIEVVLDGIGLPAEGLYPPGLPGYDEALEGLPYDPVQARRLLAESAYGGPDRMPSILYTTSGTGSSVSSSVSAQVDLWQQNLGVHITIENLEPDRYYDEINAGNHGQILITGWCADYPDPENFADVLFHTGTEYNHGHYSNPQVDALLEQTRIEQDADERILLYQEIERMIVQDAPALFLVHSLSYVLVKPHIQGYALTPIDVPLERFLWIDTSQVE